jgi:glycerol-3-phosphate dehydrogenase
MQSVAGIEEASYTLFAHRYGYAARELLALCEQRPDLRRPIVPGQPDVLAEAVFAARNEQARSVGDVLLRRTRLGLLDARALCATDAEPPQAVAAALGQELGWDPARVERETAAWHELAAAEGLDVSKLAAAPAA